MIRRRHVPLLLLLTTLGCGGDDEPKDGATGGGGSAGGNISGGGAGKGGTSATGGSAGSGGNNGGAAGGGGPELGPPFVAKRIASIDGGNCVITKAEQLYCWGVGVPPKSDLHYTQVSGQFERVCAVLAAESALETGNVWCFSEVLNAGTPMGTFAEVRVSEHSACARNAENVLTCWTDGNADAAPIVSGAPKAAVKSFYLMSDTACAVMQSGTTQCWGRDLASGPRLVPKRTDYVALGGYQQLFGIAPDGSISGWGLNDIDPIVPSGNDFVQLAGGEDHLAALHANGLVSGAGPEAAAAPVGVEFVELSAGAGQTCGVTRAGTVTCWGDGSGPEFKAPPEAVQVF